MALLLLSGSVVGGCCWFVVGLLFCLLLICCRSAVLSGIGFQSFFDQMIFAGFSNSQQFFPETCMC